MTDNLYEQMDAIFHPRSMAAVGASERIDNQGIHFLNGYQKNGFKGELYAVNAGKKIERYPTYASVADIPGPVDHVKICIPSRGVPEVMRDCAKKGVKVVTIFSSGFRESGRPENAALEEEVTRIARSGGVRIIGPNCMGMVSPEVGMTIRADMPPIESGKVGLISQSGGVCITGAIMAQEKGLGLSQGVSYGNESDLGPPEFLHYMSRDPVTEVICLYVEGTRRPAELKAALRDAAARKPVIVLKGGITELGDRAVASHTGALTGAGDAWRAMVKQAGAMMVDDFDEMFDLAGLMGHSRSPKGKRLCLLTVSGGFGVFATDRVVSAGFDMPELADDTRELLAKYLEAPGTSLHNPIDMAAKFFQPQNFDKIYPLFDADPNVDGFVLMCAIEYLTYMGKYAEKWSGFLVKALINAFKDFKKPVYVVFMHTTEQAARLEAEREFQKSGFPVFPTINRCLRAINRSISLNGKADS